MLPIRSPLIKNSCRFCFVTVVIQVEWSIVMNMRFKKNIITWNYHKKFKSRFLDNLTKLKMYLAASDNNLYTKNRGFLKSLPQRDHPS